MCRGVCGYVSVHVDVSTSELWPVPTISTAVKCYRNFSLRKSLSKKPQVSSYHLSEKIKRFESVKEKLL